MQIPEEITAITILQQLLTGFSEEEKKRNVQRTSLGGLQFFMQRFEYGNLEEKTDAAAILSGCIEADPCCRYQIARNIRQQYLLDLPHSKRVNAKTNVVMLLTELICLNRREDVNLFLSGFQNGVVNTLHALCMHLQSLLTEQKPHVAVLILHFYLLV